MMAIFRTIPRGIWMLAALALALRLAFMAVTVDLAADNYYEFGEIAKSLRAGHGYGLFHFEAETLSPWFSESEAPFPSAFMPPGYVFYVYTFLGIDSTIVRNVLLLLIQHIAGALTVVLLFLLVRMVYSPRAAWMAAVLAAFLPDMVAASSTYGATVFVHLLVLGIFLLLENRKAKRSLLDAIVLGGSLGLLVLFRFEALAFALLALGLAWRVAGFGFTGKAALAFMLLLAPWIGRNMFVFEQPVLSTSLGLNLYRGNNSEAIGAWSDPQLEALLPTLAGPMFEIRMSDAYTESALNYVTSEPGTALMRSFEKVGRLWTVDPDDDRSKHPGRVLAWILVLVFAIIGCREIRPPLYILAYVAFSTLAAGIFFALFRHQVLMEIALLPLAGHGLARFCTFARLLPNEHLSEKP